MKRWTTKHEYGARQLGTEVHMSDVLIVDDDDGIRYLVNSVLTEHGFDVRTSSNGAEALIECRANPPALIVLDLEMPVMDGRTFARELANMEHRPPIIVLSAHGARRAAREIGAAAWIDKPFDEQRLLDLVQATFASVA